LPSYCGVRPIRMRRTLGLLTLWLVVGVLANADDRIDLKVDTSEADAVLAILELRRAGKPVDAAAWEKLFSTEPYVRLKEREASLKRDFTDDDFKKFVLSADLVHRVPELRRTLEAWKKADLRAAAQRIMVYLPADARIHSKVYPVIKPKTNSFVVDVQKNPAIFLYLDAKVTEAQFENTVAHELHHIGYSSVEAQTEVVLKSLPDNVRPAVEWMGAFGEGFAMLAAAGGPDVHPHAVSDPADHERWDHDMSNFNQNLLRLNRFFLDIIQGKLSPDEQREQAGSFFGVQGPWYTVGYKMAVMVEKRYGRTSLIECMIDQRKLLRRYNMAAAFYNSTHADKLERWPQELLDAIGGKAEPEPEPAGPRDPAAI